MHGFKKIRGTVYDLTHLDSFILPVGGFRVQVQFGNHTFTEEFTALHTPDLAISNGRDLRAFCLVRYGHSLALPVAVKAAVGGDACLDQGRYHIASTLPGLTGPYLIAFTVRSRQTKKFDGVMTVVTAHHRPNLNLTLPTAPFNAVVSATLMGRKIDWKKK